MAISDSREFWLEFTLDHSEIEARKNFVKRFGVEPQYVRKEPVTPGSKTKVLRVGPVPSRTQLMTGTYGKGKPTKTEVEQPSLFGETK